MLDRSTAPAYHTIEHIDIPQAESSVLPNGNRLHILNTGQQEILKIELIFPAGNYYESQTALSYFTVKMLGEGTSERSAGNISESIDQYGAFIEFNHGVDRAGIGLYTLNKYAPEVFPIIRELIEDSIFPDKELENLKRVTRQNLRVNQQKNAYLASRKFREILFGLDHPYGRNLSEEAIEAIDREALQEYFKKHFKAHPIDILLVGKIHREVRESTVQTFGNYPLQKPLEPENFTLNSLPKHMGNLQQIEGPQQLQSSIRLGRLLFTKNHPDYFHFTVTNEIFGGYFGSRLMKNIREDKGYTYGIYSSLVMFAQEGYWMISTDVKGEFVEHTLDEIRKEAYRLQNELIPHEELETVRNYALGSFAASLNTAFDLADIFKSIYFSKLDYSFYDTYIQAIRDIQAEDIRNIAQKYLKPEEIAGLVVGGLAKD